jgi:hypothetical protein
VSLVRSGHRAVGKFERHKRVTPGARPMPAAGSEIRGRQRKETAAARRIDFSRSVEDALAVAVESDQKLVFGSRPGAINARQCVFLDQEGHLARTVMSPEANTAVPGIVAAALIRKVDRHKWRQLRPPNLGLAL